MGTANGTECPLQFTNALRFDEQIVQHMCGAHLLSWSPFFNQNTTNNNFFIFAFNAQFLEANVTSPDT
jgi:hypothetical protein